MIYIEKATNDQYVITDNISDYMPVILDIYLDDIYLGQYNNLSDNLLFLTFMLPYTTINDLVEKEYILTIKSYGATLKTELCQVRDFTLPEIIQYNKA